MLRILLLSLMGLGALILWLVPPITQDLAYHHFASPIGDVLSSFVYLPIGVWGGVVSVKRKEGTEKILWSLFFLSVFFVGVGSFLYHLDPIERKLAIDRFPMAIAFMSLLALMLGDFFSWTVAKRAAPWLLCFGAFSILYWVWHGDLRPYVWVQFVTFFALLLFALYFRGKRRAFLLGAWFSYLLAKFSEIYGTGVYQTTLQTLSGHTLKHLLSGLGVIFLIFFVKASAVQGGTQTRRAKRRKSRE